MRSRPVIRVDYDEFYPETYRAVVVGVDENTVRFDTDNPIKDAQAAVAYAEQYGRPMAMSSCDNFMADAKIELFA